MDSGPLGVRTPRKTRGFERRARGRPRLVYKPHGVRDWPRPRQLLLITPQYEMQRAHRRRRGRRNGMLGYPVLSICRFFSRCWNW
jgi:hypothetical protein